MADDFLSKKKETGPILDNYRAICNSKEEFRKLFDKVPDYKIRPIKVRTDEIKIRDKDFKFKTGKKDLKVLKETYNFVEPVPVEMKSIKLEDLINVPIDWRMLTTLRPKSKQDEDYFSRLVELGKSQLKTKQKERREKKTELNIRKSKNKAGVLETRAVSCNECGEEFCDGETCSLFYYDNFTRVNLEHKNIAVVDTSQSTDKKIKKKKTKRRSRSITKGKHRSKSKSPSKTSARKNEKK